MLDASSLPEEAVEPLDGYLEAAIQRLNAHSVLDTMFDDIETAKS